MFATLVSSFLGLLFSFHTLVVVIAYLTVCHFFIGRLGQLAFAALLSCFWAVVFTLLFAHVFFSGSSAVATIAPIWPILAAALLLASLVPALVIRFFTDANRFPRLPPIFPSLLGTFEVFWLVSVSQLVVWGTGLFVIPPFDMLILATILSIIVTTLLGLALVSLSRVLFGPRAMQDGIVFFRLAGGITIYIPICFYGACIQSLIRFA
jgi:hypothetical protein